MLLAVICINDDVIAAVMKLFSNASLPSILCGLSIWS